MVVVLDEQVAKVGRQLLKPRQIRDLRLAQVERGLLNENYMSP